MSVKELIKELNRVDDKEQMVTMWCGMTTNLSHVSYDDFGIELVSE